MIDHKADPHYSVGALMGGDRVVLGSGEWICYTCKRPLKGTYLRPVVPWEHRPEPAPATDATPIDGMNTTE